MKNLFLISILFLLTNCSSDETVTLTLNRLEITAPNEKTRIDLGETIAFSLAGFDQQNASLQITGTVVWATNNSNVSIDQNGVVTGMAIGESRISAEVENIHAFFDITIWDSSAPRTEIFVSDAGISGGPPYQILKFDENGKNPEVFTKENLAWPQDILILENEEVVLISNLNSGSIDRYNINTGAFISSFATGITGPTRMKIGADNLLYVLQWSGDGKVLRYQLDGTAMGAFTNIGVNQSIGLDWDTSGNLYVSSYANGAGGSVTKFDSQGVSSGLFVSSNLQGPTDIWFFANGELMVNDWSAGVVAKFDTNGVFVSNVISGLSQPEGVAFFDDGNFLIGNGGTGALKMYSRSNSYIKDLVIANTGNLLMPNAITLRKVN